MQKYIIVSSIVFGFIIFDILTGLLGAYYNGNFNSSVMRKGGIRKITELLTVALSIFMEYAVKYIDIGIDIPFSIVFTAYIAIMEFISIMENLSTINPDLFKLFKPYLEKLKGDKKDV